MIQRIVSSTRDHDTIGTVDNGIGYGIVTPFNENTQRFRCGNHGSDSQVAQGDIITDNGNNQFSEKSN